MRQGFSRLLPSNLTDYTAFNTSNVEGSLLAGGGGIQPHFPSGTFVEGGGVGRAWEIIAGGVCGSTGTPTITFQWRLGVTQGSASLAGTSVGASAAITMANGVTNIPWEARHILRVTAAGMGTGLTTIQFGGWVKSSGGFAAPYEYPVPNSATWTATFDAALTYYLNLSVTFSASSASNTATLKRLLVKELD